MVTVLEVGDVKKYLNMGSTSNDVELEVFLEAAETIVARHVGPLEPTEVEARVAGGGRSLLLPVRPAISITSISGSDAGAMDVGTLALDTPSARVEMVDSGRCFPAANYTVVYQAGHDPLPADIKLAVLELVRHLFATQRGPTARGGPNAGAATPAPGAAYALPNRVLDLIKPYTFVNVA